MRFDENAEIDTSNIRDVRGSGGGGLGGRVAVGGGGVSIVGLIIYFLLSQLGGGGGGGGGLPSGLGGLGAVTDNQSTGIGQIAESCRTGRDANSAVDCEVAAVTNSLDAYWSDVFARSNERFSPPLTYFFRGSVQTGCGGATSDVGPFYCPADNNIYIDLRFFEELEQRFGADGGPFSRAYVIAHEYGHHIQALLGTSNRVRAGDTGPTSGSVRLELQADCYAGAWGNHATTTPGANGRPLIVELNDQDLRAALDTAARIGDDYIQSELAGRRVDESQFTHGSSAQREKWFRVGFDTGEPGRCDTFARGVDLG
ncbi:MAG: neutral zinc metallopeptidase [Pseudonocardia sp.]|nr:neutral zinc metallopeptidase [Pseudonocardia sp.]